MDGLLEFLFERVPPKRLASMVLDLIREETNVDEATRRGLDIPRTSVMDPAFWNRLAISDDDTTCHVNLRTIIIKEKSIARATIMIVRYDEITDVSVLLSTTDCRQANLFASKKIYYWARTISKKFGIDNFCGGLDSAFDEHTQMYTNGGVSSIETL